MTLRAANRFTYALVGISAVSLLAASLCASTHPGLTMILVVVFVIASIGSVASAAIHYRRNKDAMKMEPPG